jgi:hypothetical protein
MVKSTDPLVAAAMKWARHAAVHEIESALGPALNTLSPSQGRTLVINLHMVCAWPSWETLRIHHKVPPLPARTSVRQVALSILRDAFSSPKRLRHPQQK